MKKFTQKAWWFFLLPLLILGFVFREQLIGAVKPPPKYKTTKVTKTTLTQTVAASGKVKAEEEAVLKFQTAGYLKWLGVKKGDRVKRGQIIASLDKETLEKELKQEILDYLNERWNFEKDRRTYHITSDDLDKYSLSYDIRNLLEKAQFDLDRTVLDVEIKNLALKYANLWSPIDGLVTALDTETAGINITPTTATFTISNPASMVFVAKVDEADIGKIKVGQKAEIFLDAYPEEKISSSVSQIDFTSTLTSSGGTAYEVKFSLPTNEEEKFKIGMNGDVEIIVAEKPEALVVPLEAVREKNNKTYVWLVVNGQPKQQEVKTASGNESQTEILSGLAENDEVVIADFKNLDKLAK